MIRLVIWDLICRLVPRFFNPSWGRTASSSLITLLAAMLFVAKNRFACWGRSESLTDTELVQFLGQWCPDCHGPDTQERLAV